MDHLGRPLACFCEQARGEYTIDALDDREAVAYAGMYARDKCHQVTVDARQPVHRLGNVIPSLRPIMLPPSNHTI